MSHAKNGSGTKRSVKEEQKKADAKKITLRKAIAYGGKK